MNVRELIARTRSILGDKTSKRTNGLQWSDAEILEALNAANDTLWNLCLAFDEGWGEDVATLQDLGCTISDLGGNVLITTIPKDVQLITDVEEGWDGNTPGITLPKIDRRDRYIRGQLGWTGTGRRGWWQGTDRTIMFLKNGSIPATSTIRLWFHRSAPQLAMFMAESTSTTALKVQIDSATDPLDGGLGALIPRKDYYRNSFLECLDNGGDAPETEEVAVGAFTKGTHPEWTFTVSAHTQANQGALWATVPFWPTQHHEFLCLTAAAAAFSKGGDPAGKAIVQQEAADKRAQFINTMEQRQLQTPRYVNYTGATR